MDSGEGGSEEGSDNEGNEMEWEGIAPAAKSVRGDSSKVKSFNRPPTRDELRVIKEASDLFSSNSFKLQVRQLHRINSQTITVR